MNGTHFRIEGRVQGVGFRYWVAGEARRLGLQGWVRNLPDGSVELEAAGPPEAMGEFAGLLHRGPPAARVSRVSELPARVTGEGFQIL